MFQKLKTFTVMTLSCCAFISSAHANTATYPIVTINQSHYQANNNGTVTDLTTGLMWQTGYQVMSYDDALEYAKNATTGGYQDWRVPTLKELYSLIDFNGVDASQRDMFTVPQGAKPFIDTRVFDFDYGTNGERVIDSQYLTQTLYSGKVMGRDAALFGVNFADGRIKGYPLVQPRTQKANQFTVRLVRGNTEYGQNQFVDNQNGTISDMATQLMWMKEDSQQAMDWPTAQAWIDQLNQSRYLGYNDWRLPDIKELQSIVDYDRSPQATHSAAIDPIFSISTITDEGGKVNYPAFWSNTTHLQTGPKATSQAAYICFGECLGYMNQGRSNQKQLMDVHGAGAQRAEPKQGDASRYPNGFGPQGDVIRIQNYVRAVRSLS